MAEMDRPKPGYAADEDDDPPLRIRWRWVVALVFCFLATFPGVFAFLWVVVVAGILAFCVVGWLLYHAVLLLCKP